MSEYIYEHKPSGADHMGKPVKLPTLVQREEIVRCRDCRHYDPNDAPSDVYPDRYWCDRLTVYMPTDGFCSFGKRKEGEK